MTESDSQGSKGVTPIGTSRSKPLPKQIQEALQTCKDNGNAKTFLPDDKLAEIMTTENVKDYLSNSAKKSLREHHIRIIGHVCGQTGRSNTRRESRRIFAILLLIREPCLILDFVEQGIDDSDLPLSIIHDNSSSLGLEGSVDGDEDDYLARSTSDGPIIIRGFCQWHYTQRETFYNNQWRVQIPIFRKVRRQIPDAHPIHTFGNEVILPWTECEEHYDGNSVVSRVKVHKAHSQLLFGVSEVNCYQSPVYGLQTRTQDDQSLALKSLKPIVRHDGEQEFRLEVKALLKVKARPHLENGLLTSFKYRDRFNLLFRWADGGNLRDLWTEHTKRPDLNYSRICWMAQQVHGLAHALDGIHNTKMTVSEVEAVQKSPLSPEFPQQSFDFGPIPTTEDNEGRDYGRHGDIKPENVLWFRQDTSHHEFGILKLSDFGLTTFHRALTRGLKAAEVRVTNTYSAPEREIEESLSRPFDVWSLGCIFLEFVTWILLGSKYIKAFQDARLKDGGGPNPNFSLDNFFTVFRDDEARLKAGVKPSVSKVSSSFNDLRQSPDHMDIVDNQLEEATKV